ncbi:protein lin-37 homolog [Rhagoletis pomonella]|uniref:protein lin-37 homolog n=1 Tax=Rhagoletis pomonella TaxID=28610 RepID=UPI00177E3E05|nr:protein lin-37 homolog [Rhagoletis pomonella]
MRTPPQRRKVQNDVQLARGRLRNALNETSAGSDDDGNVTEEDLPHRGRPPKNLNNLHRERTSPRSLRQRSLSPGKYLTPSKRRKREEQRVGVCGLEKADQSSQPTQKIQAESFVMKLFDRSLDLSKYTEQTALYPICRAWMSNQPRNTNIRSYRDRRSPSPVERDTNAAELLEKLRSREMRELKAMPAAHPTEVSKIPAFNHEVSTTEEIDANVFDEDGLLLNSDKDKLLGMHLNKWREIKSSWLKHNRDYQKRYEFNHLILQELFKP